MSPQRIYAQVHIKGVSLKAAAEEPGLVRVHLVSERGSHLAVVNATIPEARRVSIELARAIAQAAAR